jgi:carbamate kinase
VRIVAALGGNALLERGERPDSDVQIGHVRQAVRALAPLAAGHELLITHGNGPQVGLLAIETAADRALSHPYPFDVLGAQTQGMIGYWLVQELAGACTGKAAVCVLCRTVVGAGDPAFGNPTKFVGPAYTQPRARRLAAAHGWAMRQDGPAWRRVVPSPEPVELVELETIKLLASLGAIVVCAGGGGVPVLRGPGGALRGVEAVVDKDLTAALLARETGADALLLLTDVEAVLADYGTPAQWPIHLTTPELLRKHSFPTGSMGPKVEAACRFAEQTPGVAAIGRLDQAPALLAGTAGTIVKR